MAESKERQKSSPPDDPRETAHDREGKRRDYAAGADGTQDVDVDAAGTREESKDHSEREWGGDQDIDTAGMIPGNKATDNKEPTGF